MTQLLSSKQKQTLTRFRNKFPERPVQDTRI